jgi:hypothetical protein
MPSIDDIAKQLDAVTDKISTLVRSVSLGVLAIAWLFLSGNKDAPHFAALAHSSSQFLAIAGLCILALVADLAQYICGLWSALQAYDVAKASNTSSANYANDWRKKGREIFFSAKQWLALGAALWLVVVLGYAAWP